MITEQTPVAAIQARKRPAMIGGMIGMVAVLGAIGYVAYGLLMTPDKPSIATASQREVVEFISNPRGLRKLPRVEQEKLLLGWRQSLMSDEAKQTELKKCFDGMNDVERSDFTESVFDHIKRAFVEDARAYAQTPSNERYKFLREKFQAYTGEAMFMKQVAGSFKGGAAVGYDEQQKWIIEHTTPAERAICEPYVQALQDTREHVKKEQRNTASQPATSPG